MNIGWQELVVFLIVLVALFYLGRYLYKTFKADNCNCGCETGDIKKMKSNRESKKNALGFNQ